MRWLAYFFPFLVFLGAAFFEGTAFFCVDLAPEDPPRLSAADLPENATSQPAAYFWFVPMRVIVTAFAS